PPIEAQPVRKIKNLPWCDYRPRLVQVLRRERHKHRPLRSIRVPLGVPSPANRAVDERRIEGWLSPNRLTRVIRRRIARKYRTLRDHLPLPAKQFPRRTGELPGKEHAPRILPRIAEPLRSIRAAVRHHRARGDQRHHLIHIHIQILHLPREEGRLASRRPNVRILLAGGSGVVHQIAVHPVVFAIAYDRLDALAERTANPRSPALTAAARKSSNHAIVIRRR